jgi:N-acetylglucosamine kinase-like BadF-type ATPase
MSDEQPVENASAAALDAAQLVLGIDGGNTKTLALLARRDGTIVGWGRGGCGDIYGAGSPEAAFAHVATAVGQARAQAGVGQGVPTVGAFSMAGADWPEDFVVLREGLGHLAAQVTIVNDGIGALRAGSPDNTGVVVACGTGVATAARAPGGRTWHSSWWQEPQGGHQLAHKALQAVYRAALGLDPPTALTPVVLRFFGQETVEDVLHLFTARVRPPATSAQMAGLAPLLLDTAQQGDATAQRIVRTQGTALGDYALVAARQVGIEGTAFPLVLTGGVLRHPSPLLSEAIIAQVQTTSPTARPISSRFEPVVGALLLALEAAGVRVDEPLLARLEATMPPVTLFMT